MCIYIYIGICFNGVVGHFDVYIISCIMIIIIIIVITTYTLNIIYSDHDDYLATAGPQDGALGRHDHLPARRVFKLAANVVYV